MSHVSTARQRQLDASAEKHRIEDECAARYERGESLSSIGRALGVSTTRAQQRVSLGLDRRFRDIPPLARQLLKAVSEGA